VPSALQERIDVLGRESEQDRATKASEATRLLEEAKERAAILVADAKEQAERVRRESERELAAATARRDSITAQLSNVRNMLATLGGGNIAMALGEVEPAAAAAGGEQHDPVDAPAADLELTDAEGPDADASDAPAQDAEDAPDRTDDRGE